METSQNLFRSGKAAKNSFRKRNLRHAREKALSFFLAAKLGSATQVSGLFNKKTFASVSFLIWLSGRCVDN